MNPQNQGPQFPHQNDDYAQQQAEVERQMQQILASPDPILQAQKPKRTIGILALIFSVILPPIGAILAVISIFKGFVSKKDKPLGFMGIGSLVLSILMSTVIIVAISSPSRVLNSSDDAAEAAEGVDATELSLNGVSLQLNVSAEFDEVERTDNYITWESEGDAFTDRMSLSVTPLNSSEEEAPREAISPDDAFKVWENTILLNDLSECTDPVIKDIDVKVADVKEATQSSYECEVANDEGQTNKFKGLYISIVTADDDEITLHYFIQEENWSVPSTIAEQVVKTVRTDKETDS